MGMRFDGFNVQKDTWFDNEVPDRGATFVFASPTLSWNFSDKTSIGGFVRVPIYINLVGDQMVAPYSIGVEMSTSLNPLFDALLRPLGREE